MGAPKKPINKKPAAEDSELDDEDDDLDLKPKKKVDEDEDFDGPLDDLDGYATFNDYDDDDDDF